VDTFINSIVPMMTPVLFAALGGLFTHLSGLLNIGLEGLMLLSAFFSIYVAHLTHNLFFAVLAGIGISMLLAVFAGFLSLNLRANIFVVGLGVNLFANGFTVMLLVIILYKGNGFFPELAETLLYRNTSRSSHSLFGADSKRLRRVGLSGDRGGRIVRYYPL